MFKGMNKMWKGIALVLCLCMLPTVAFATGENTVAISYATPSTAESVKVAVAMSDTSGVVAATDVTILALRRASDAAAYEGSLNVETAEAGPAIPTDAATLQKQVAYIDQKATNAEGAVSFEFVPASFDAEYASRYIDIYVGGAGVSAIKHMVVDMPSQSPTLSLPSEYVWYKGGDLELTISGPIVEKPNKADLLAAWAANVQPIFVVTDGDDIEIDIEVTDVAEWIDTENNLLVIPSEEIAGRTISEIRFESGTHTNIDNILTAPISETAKRPGTATQTSVALVEGVFTATYDLADDIDDGFDWVADLGDFGAAVGDDVVDYVVAEGTLTVKFVAMPTDVETHEYSFAIEVEDYTAVNKTVSVTAPTKVAYDALTALPAGAVYTGEFHTETDGLPVDALPYDSTETEEKQKQIWGKQSITLEDTIEGDLTTAWQVFKVGSDVPVVGAEGVYPLARSWEESVSYKAVATISMTGYKTMTREFAITGAGAQLGVDGVTVNVTVSFEEAGAAAAATVTLGGYTLELSEGTTFTVGAVIPGEYTLTVARPGYVKQEIAVKVTNDGTVTLADDSAFAMDAMVFGDNTGRTGDPDGSVNSRDYNALLDAYNVADNYDVKFDFNADGRVNSRDYNKLLDNYGYPNI